MSKLRSAAIITLLGSMSMLVACGANRAPDAEASAKQEEKTIISQAVTEAITEARQEINQGNITISEHDLPKAEITPKGDLLISGRAVAITPAQRTLLLEHRGHVIAIAESGMEIGAQGADLATKAMGEALKGVFTGKSEQEIEKSVEAEASEIKAAAAKLCDRLPAMMASQQALAAALPEFKPYATMDQSDIDDCMKDTDTAGDEQSRAQRQDEIRNRIRNGIRTTIQTTAQEAGVAEKGETATTSSQAEEAAPATL
ncbi:MAG TPA: DUF2884 family protein [Lysobacter sp.]